MLGNLGKYNQYLLEILNNIGQPSFSFSKLGAAEKQLTKIRP